jgi:hypothetical protein
LLFAYNKEIVMRNRWFAHVLIASLFMLAAAAGATQAAPLGDKSAQLVPIGAPTWTLDDCHLFSAPIGTAQTGYAEAFETFASLLPPPEHVPIAALGIGPGAAHQPPYDTELAESIAHEGYREGRRFRPSEFSNGNGVFLACMALPAPGTTGSSPDFAAGPIIANSLFPISVSGTAKRNGNVFDPALASFSVPPLTTEIDPRFDVDGHSHFPLFVGTNQDFGPPGESLRGLYEYQLTLTDAAGNGWMLRAQFVVGP